MHRLHRKTMLLTFWPKRRKGWFLTKYLRNKLSKLLLIFLMPLQNDRSICLSREDKLYLWKLKILYILKSWAGELRSMNLSRIGKKCVKKIKRYIERYKNQKWRRNDFNYLPTRYLGQHSLYLGCISCCENCCQQFGNYCSIWC